MHEDGDNIIGRSDDCEVHLPVDGISKKHFSITVTADVAYLKDLGSSNGTYVNKKSVQRITKRLVGNARFFGIANQKRSIGTTTIKPGIAVQDATKNTLLREDTPR